MSARPDTILGLLLYLLRLRARQHAVGLRRGFVALAALALAGGAYGYWRVASVPLRVRVCGCSGGDVVRGLPSSMDELSAPAPDGPVTETMSPSGAVIWVE